MTGFNALRKRPCCRAAVVPRTLRIPGIVVRPRGLPLSAWMPNWRAPSGRVQAAYRPRDVAKQREPARTVEYLERQARGGFRMFVQVSGLGCIDLGDRRSRVQISAARQTRTSTTSHEVESSVSSSPSNQHGRLPASANAARSAGVIQATVSSDGYMKLLGSVEWPTPKMWVSSCSTLS